LFSGIDVAEVIVTTYVLTLLRFSRKCKLRGISDSNIPLKGSPYSTAERRVSELILVLGSQPAGDVSHKPDGRLPLLSARPVVTPATLKRAATNFAIYPTI